MSDISQRMEDDTLTWKVVEDPRGGFRLNQANPEDPFWFSGSQMSREAAERHATQVNLVTEAWHAAESVREDCDEFDDESYRLVQEMANAAYDLHSRVLNMYEERDGDVHPFVPRVVE